MKLDNDFKNSTKQDFKEADYVGLHFGFRIIIVVLVITILGSISTVTYKKWRVNQDREIFKQSVTYNEGAAEFLAKSYKEYNAATDKDEKKAIMNYVSMRYPNLDSSNIENATLRMFYNNCIMGGN